LGLLPNPLDTEDQFRRFHHLDIPELPAERVWAEKTLLTVYMAERIYTKARPQMLSIERGEQVTDLEWCSDRLNRLKSRGGRRE
jgi:hypothetical protein